MQTTKTTKTMKEQEMTCRSKRMAAGKAGAGPWKAMACGVALFVGTEGLHAQKPGALSEKLPERVEKFTVRTSSDLNREIPFYLRVPKNYRPGKVHRLLFLCPHLNQEGLKKLEGSAKWLALADERDWFVMSCTFKQEKKSARDRKLAYYYPEGFSGKATLEALEIAAKKYPLDPQRLLMQGLSGGAQFVHRFALWAPDRVSAVAVNSSSWFDPPNEKAKRVAWLITIGDSDGSYNETLDMVERLRGAGAAPLFRSYMGMVHEGSGAVDRLSMEFLKFHDERTRGALGKRRSALTPPEEWLSMKAADMPYVGDSQDWKFWPNKPDAREAIAEDSRIYLPSETIARLWGKQEETE
jgi:poly(3-hydroxybutyrate) depolymerase